MIHQHNPDEWMVDEKHETCQYHIDHPEDTSYAGCCCHSSYGLVRKLPTTAAIGNAAPQNPALPIAADVVQTVLLNHIGGFYAL